MINATYTMIGEYNSSKSVIDQQRTGLLMLRLITITIMVAALTTHVRSMRVFRWEQSVSGGVLVTYMLAALGLALCAYTEKCGIALQVYMTGSGAILLGLNAVILWQRWKSADELTRVVAELLVVVGVPLRRQLLTKIYLSVAAAIALIIDLGYATVIDQK